MLSLTVEEFNKAVMNGRADFLAGRIPKGNLLHCRPQSGLRPSVRPEGRVSHFELHLAAEPYQDK